MIAQADAARIPLPDQSVHCCVTSPPYWGLRKYAGEQGEEPLGLEPTPERHVERIVEICREVRRVLRDDGVLWLNYGDCYASTPAGNPGYVWADGRTRYGSEAGERQKPFAVTAVKQGSLMMMPHRVALALQADGWIIRQDLVWFKRNPMPESVRGWAFIRHRVRISNHAHLSSVSEENGGYEDGSSDLPLMPRRIEGPEAAGFSTDENGQSSESTIRQERKRQEGSKEIQGIRKGQRNSEDRPRSEVRGRSRKTQGTLAEMEQISSQQSSAKAIRGKQEGQEEKSGSAGAVQEIPERVSVSGKKRSKATSQSRASRSDANRGGVGGDKSESQTPMLLLQSQDGTVDDGSRNPVEQEREAHQGKHSSSLSELQQPQGGKDNKTSLIDCPGCDECDPNDGYVLRKGSFRHTRAHEYVFMLTKKMQYWSNQEAVREAHKAKPWGKRKAQAKIDISRNDSEAFTPDFDPDSSRFYNSSGRNPRSVLDVPTAPYKGAHYATFPPNLIAPLIRATCPRWACPVCGQGWAAVVEKASGGAIGAAWLDHSHDDERGGFKTESSDGYERGNVLGYRPTCKHPHTQEEAVPGIVFDPFVGSGTTVKVAQDLLRKGIGIDLSMEYLDLQAKVRIGQGSPSNQLDDLPLFQ